LRLVVGLAADVVRGRAGLGAENAPLRQQLIVARGRSRGGSAGHRGSASLGNDVVRREAPLCRILCAVLLGSALSVCGAWADDAGSARPAPDLVNQANAPISSILQLRLQDTWVPEIAQVRGQANTFSVAVTMPLPKYRLLPLPQLSLLTIPAVNTLPDGSTGF